MYSKGFELLVKLMMMIKQRNLAGSRKQALKCPPGKGLLRLRSARPQNRARNG